MCLLAQVNCGNLFTQNPVYHWRQDSAYERARDSKLFAGLMSLDEIKAKKARIESGEEFEGAAAKAARARRADQEAAVRERLVTPAARARAWARNPHREPAPGPPPATCPSRNGPP